MYSTCVCVWRYKTYQLCISSHAVPHASNETNTHKLHRIAGILRANCKNKFAGENVFRFFFLLRRCQFISLRSNSTWCYGYSDSGIRVFDQELHPKIPIQFFFETSRGWNFELSNIFPDEGLIWGLIARSSRTMARGDFSSPVILEIISAWLPRTSVRTRTNTFTQIHRTWIWCK